MKNELMLNGFSVITENELLVVDGGGRVGGILVGAACVCIGGVIAITGGAALLGGAAFVVVGSLPTNSLGMAVSGIALAVGGAERIASHL